MRERRTISTSNGHGTFFSSLHQNDQPKVTCSQQSKASCQGDPNHLQDWSRVEICPWGTLLAAAGHRCKSSVREYLSINQPPIRNVKAQGLDPSAGRTNMKVGWKIFHFGAWCTVERVFDDWMYISINWHTLIFGNDFCVTWCLHVVKLGGIKCHQGGGGAWLPYHQGEEGEGVQAPFVNVLVAWAATI